MKQQISLQNGSYLNQMMRNFNQLEEVRKSKNNIQQSNEHIANTPLQLSTNTEALNTVAKLPTSKNSNNQLTPKGQGYQLDQGFQNRYGNSQSTPKQLENHSISSDVYPNNMSGTPQQNQQKHYSNQINQLGNAIQQILPSNSQAQQQQQQQGLNSSGLNTSANYIKASKIESKQNSQLRSSAQGISYIKDRRTTVDITPSYLQKGNLKNYYVPNSSISSKEGSSSIHAQNQQNSFINNSGYSNQQNQQLSTTNKQSQSNQSIANNSSNNFQNQLQNSNLSANSNSQLGIQNHQVSPQQQLQQQYQQANFYELQTPKQRYNYSRSMTENLPTNQSKLQSQSNSKEANNQQQQQQQQQQQYQQQQQQSMTNQFPSQYSAQNSAKSTYLQQNTKQYQNQNSNYQQQQYYQIQNTQGMQQQQQQQNSFSNSQVQVQPAQQVVNASQTQFSNQQTNEKEPIQETAQNQLSQQNQQQFSFNQVKSSINTQKKNANSSNTQNGSTSLNNINDTTNMQSISTHQQSISSSNINMYNPYSLKKLTPTKSRQHHSINQRNGLNIETNNLNYGNLNSPYINSLSISSVRSAANNISNNQSNSSSSRNPYNLGLYSNKSLSKSKDLSLIRQSSTDSQKQQQAQLQSESPLSSDIANEKPNQQNQQSGVASQVINQSAGNNQSNKSKSPKLSTASFAQLKSPISSNKVFLSPQSKFTIGFNNNASVTSRKQSSGSENINIFQMQSISHSHINSSHSALRNSSTQGNNHNKLLSTSTQALPSSSQMNSINLTSQQAGTNNTQKNKSNNSVHNNLNNLSDSINRNNNNNNNNNANISQISNNSSKSQKFDQTNSQGNYSNSSGNQNNNNSYAVKASIERVEIEPNDFSKDLSQISNKSGLHSKIQILQQPNSDEIPYEQTQTANMHSSIIDLINTTVIPNHEKTKYSVKRNGIVKSYAANTNQGLIRNYNEDRVSIILNIMKPQGKNTDNDVQWPKCSFFGVYDGHGGVTCADFLRDNLHQFVIKDSNFPKNPKQAILNGFETAEKQFLKQAQIKEGQIEKSGSCAIVVMIVGTRCYVANVGDSRAIMSGQGGQRAYELSRDHKPLDEFEQKRIQDAGGKIYQTKIMNFQNAFGSASSIMGMSNLSQPIYGPHRVLPGRLSVTRTFGDIEAKLTKLGGNPNVVIAVPDIKEFEIQDDFDFILLASDGIFDKLTTKESIESIWHQAENQKQNQYQNVHEFCGLAVDTIMKFSLGRKTMDNITVVLIGFDNLKRQLFPHKIKSKNQKIEQNQHSLNENINSEKNQQTNQFQQQQSEGRQEDFLKKQSTGPNQSGQSIQKLNDPSKVSLLQQDNYLQQENSLNNKHSLHVANENQYNLSMSPYSKATPKENGMKFQMNQNSENQINNNNNSNQNSSNKNIQQENKQQYLQNQFQYQSQQNSQPYHQQLYQQVQNQVSPNSNSFTYQQQNNSQAQQKIDKSKSKQPLTPGASMLSQGIQFQPNDTLSVRASANPPSVSSLINNQKQSSYSSSYNNYINSQLGNNYGKQGQSDNLYQQQLSQQMSTNNKQTLISQQQQSQQSYAQPQQPQQQQEQVSIKSPYSQQNSIFNQKYNIQQIQGQQNQQQQQFQEINSNLKLTPNNNYNKN